MTSLDPTMKIGKQLQEVTGSQAQALDALSRAGITDPEERLSSYPHQLSGGLRQRVMIAMAVSRSPRLIVADEPTTALDVTVQARILDLLQELQSRSDCSILLITHDLAVAAQIADRIVVLYGGRIAETGPAAELLSEPRHPYTAALLESRLDLGSDRRRDVATIRGEPPNPRALPPGCPFAPRCDHALPACDAALPVLVADGKRADACYRGNELDLGRRTQCSVPMGRAEGGASRELVLEAKGLGVELGSGSARRKVLENLSIDVRAGEALALVGESGSGKTTFVRAVAGLVPASAGALEVNGHPQMVFQDAGASLTPWLRVGEIIEDRLRRSGLRASERRRRVAETLESVGLPAGAARARPRELSGGQRQRVAIARAIVDPPALLLCDEPTSALDVSVAAGVLNLIASLRRELGVALVFITHDLAVARLVADRIAVMREGRILECGPAEDVVANPTEPYTRTLVTAVPGLRPKAAV